MHLFGAAKPGSVSWPSQPEHEFFPLPFECFHVLFPENALERGEARGVVIRSGNELVVKLRQQSLFLEVIAEIPSLRVMLAITVAAVELARTHRCELLK